MKKLFKSVVVALPMLTVSAFASASSNAFVDNVEGTVVFKHSGAFGVVTQPTAISAGDSVIALDASAATVVLSETCSLSLSEGQAADILANSDVCEEQYALRAVTAGELTDLESSGLALGLPAILAATAVLAGIVVVVADDDNSP